jgi:hypothetical protein
MGVPTVTPLNEQWHDGGFIVSEANGHLSRDQVSLTGAVKILAGTVLGQKTTGGKFAPLAPASADGTQVAAGILFGTRDVIAADKNGVAVVRSAEVNLSELIWPVGATQAQIVTATAQLKALNIITR